MKKFLLSLALLAAALIPASAQQRTEAEAQAIAKAFMQNNGYEFNITKSAKANKMRTSNAGDITPYFIFNDTRNGGYVIVGGQEGMSDILAYSNDECFDTQDTPPAAAEILEAYAQVAKYAAENPEASMAEKKAAAKAFKASGFALRKSVPPLLGEIKFNQGDPYNRQCPTLDRMKNGKKEIGKAVVGCSATAFGMILRYWKYPAHSNGSKTYSFSYEYSDTESKSMELSVNFDSVGDYDWDNMLPTYRSGISFTDNEAKAVSKLLFHCGVALGAGYGLGGTGAVTDGHKYETYFGYEKCVSSITCKNYLSDPPTLRAMLADELSQGRPMLGKGSNKPDEYNGHAYVCDGFDMNGLFHFNLGWDGSSNGYFEVAPVPTSAYGHQMTVYTNIHPKGRLTPRDPARRVIMEMGHGDWNSKSKTMLSAVKALDADKLYGESMIVIATADTEEAADAHLAGLSKIEGILFDRCDTFTGTMSQKKIIEAYKKRFNAPSPASITVNASYTSDTTMAVTVYTEFYKAYTDANFKMAFAYTENNTKIEGVTYNNIARGMYPNKDGFDNCLPSNIEYDLQYIYENEIPIPASIEKTENATLIAMLIDGNTGTIVNANTVDLKQVDTWRANQKPSFFAEGKLLGATSETTVYKFDEEKNRMAFPIRLDNPLYEKMPVEVVAEAVELADKAQIQVGETENATAQTYNLAANCVDSTMMLYLNIGDKYTDSKSTIKLTLKYKGNTIAEQNVNFEFFKSVPGFNAYTVRVTGTLNEMVSDAAQDSLSIITLGGRICGKDIIYLRDSLKLKTIDMSQAKLVEGPGAYYGDYLTENDIVSTRLFAGMKANTIILPNDITTISNYAFYQNTKLTKVVLGNNVNNINNYAFSGCEALERITIPASVKEIGRQAFKGCPVVCVICEGETPASAGSKAFDTDAAAKATLVVPTEAAIDAYKAASVWKNFGSIISHDQYLTNIAPATEDAEVTIKDGKVIVAEDAEVAIYTFAGKLVAKGNAGEYELPAGNYIVKVGNKAVKIKM